MNPGTVLRISGCLEFPNAAEARRGLLAIAELLDATRVGDGKAGELRLGAGGKFTYRMDAVHLLDDAS